MAAAFVVTPYQHNFLHMSIEKFSTDCVIERLAWNLSDFTFAEPVGREIMWLVSHLQNYATFRLASLFEAFRESWHQHILISEKPAANEIPRIVRTQTKAKELTGPDLCRSPSKSDNIWVSASSSEIECPKSVVKCPRRLLHPYRHDESARVHIWLMTSSAKAKNRRNMNEQNLFVIGSSPQRFALSLFGAKEYF